MNVEFTKILEYICYEQDVNNNLKVVVRILFSLKTLGWDAHMGEYKLNGRDGQKKKSVYGVMGIYGN